MAAQGPDGQTDTAVGLATADLRREHVLILRAVDLLERAGRRVVSGRAVDDAALQDLVGLLRTLSDQCHHGKEEGFLFPSMKEKGLPPDDSIRKLLAAHGEGRDYLGTLAGLPSRAERAAAALLYVRLMREHIEKENALVFPVADAMFSPEEQATLARSYREMEELTFGAGFGERVQEELGRLERVIPA